MGLLLIHLLLASPPSLQGQELFDDSSQKGKLELGLFMGVASLPHYRSSNESNFYGLPLPLIIYHGKWVQSNREGLSGLIFKNKSLKIALSLFGHPPVKSDSAAREGMDELDPMLELGPQLIYSFKDTPSTHWGFTLKLRSVFSFDRLDSKDRGYRGLGQFFFHRKRLGSRERFRWSASLNILGATQDYHSYFYDINAHEVRSGRPLYRAKAGYSGMDLRVSAQFQQNKTSKWGTFISLSLNDGSAYRESPLFKDKTNLAVGVALSKILYTKMLD